MKIKRISKYYIFVLVVYLNNSCSIQNNNIKQRESLNNFLLFEVSYSNTSYIGGSSVAYSLLDMENFKEFKVFVDEDSITPNITYNITANKGVYISELYTAFERFGCCEYQSTNDIYHLYFNDGIKEDELDTYANLEEVSLTQFMKKKSCFFRFKKGNKTYKIRAWLVDLQYCKCSMLLSSVQQPIWGEELGVIKSIKSIKKPNKRICKEIYKLLELMFRTQMKKICN
jgi:hypothetical protein